MRRQNSDPRVAVRKPISLNVEKLTKLSQVDLSHVAGGWTPFPNTHHCTEAHGTNTGPGCTWMVNCNPA